VHPPWPSPTLLVRPEGLLDKLAGIVGVDDIDFESSEFSKRFCGVTVWGEVAAAGRSRRWSGVLARRGRGGMGPGIGAGGRLRPGGRGRA
jgi:hypothetical protein